MNHEIKRQNKHRSRSCINNRDNFFNHHSGVVSPNLRQYQVSKEKRDKSNDGPLNKTQVVSNCANPYPYPECKKRNRDKNNCVVELSMIKKEVDDEIRRDRKNNLITSQHININSIRGGNNAAAVN